MDLQELTAFAVFGSYFVLIFLSFALVFRSILVGSNVRSLLQGRAFFFLRTAVGALLCTWYFMVQFLAWSYDDFARRNTASLGQWLVHTPLFEQAWTVVCTGRAHWWWSSWICTWTIIFTAIVWTESGRRGIKYPYAYMLLGQLVAMSVATSLFITAMCLHPRIRATPRTVPMYIALPLVMAFIPTFLLPRHVGTDSFMSSLLWLHGALLLPLTSSATSKIAVNAKARVPLTTLYTAMLGVAAAVHVPATRRLLASIRSKSLMVTLYNTAFSHPAQGSISLDVVWVALILVAWFVLSGPLVLRLTKGTAVAAIAGTAIIRHTGVNWVLVGSIVPILTLLGFGLTAMGLSKLRATNLIKRKNLLEKMGMPESTLVPGTENRPPSVTGSKLVVGFWHPYCNAGGGGERVLWTAVRHLQRTEKDLLVLVYSGDVPAASKEEILTKVKTRFSIELDASRLHFVPLPSRHLVSDNYWRRFTLLGQSLGSIVLAWEGLCGSEGLWGDIFIDSMGYAFTFPFARLIAGSDLSLGAYVHYPTVSADMVKRVQERSAGGVENAGASKSWLRTQVKLVYYYIFTSLYSVSLLFSQHIMTNSSWTQAHIQSLLTAGRSSYLASFLLKDESAMRKMEESKQARLEDRAQCEVVYPPCDTTEFAKLGSLEKRKRELVSLAQFRPEKDHAKQLYALEVLFENYPQYRKGPEKITLAMMGGARDAKDEERLLRLRQLAVRLEVHENVEFIANAPYPEIVRRLGAASIGLNTMMDEHFGISVVEFMAAGLIPIVHASAGPLMDIVVPYDGRRTGFQATDAESFAEAIHAALSLSGKDGLIMRKTAREAAVRKFSEAEFEKGWEKGWMRLKRFAQDAKQRA
ncbi:hypothetical protein IAU60_001616 [Kwoniella sp. DSM 27419]